jgi:hypothetical protein
MLIQGILYKQAEQTLKLECSLGLFTIYDTRLAHLSDGKRTGIFELKSIKAAMQSGTNSQGLSTLQLETVAELNTYAFLSMDAEKTVEPKATTKEARGKPSLKAFLADKQLFGKLWPLGDRVKLDEADPHFREQVKRMNELKASMQYTYIGSDKVWVKLKASSTD